MPNVARRLGTPSLTLRITSATFDASAPPTDTTVTPTAAVRGRRFRIAAFFTRLLGPGGWLDGGTPTPAPAGLAAFFLLLAVFHPDVFLSAGRAADDGVVGVIGGRARIADRLGTGVGVSTPAPFLTFLPPFLELASAVSATGAVPAEARPFAPGVVATRLGVMTTFFPDAAFGVLAAGPKGPAREPVGGMVAPLGVATPPQASVPVRETVPAPASHPSSSFPSFSLASSH